MPNKAEQADKASRQCRCCVSAKPHSTHTARCVCDNCTQFSAGAEKNWTQSQPTVLKTFVSFI